MLTRAFMALVLAFWLVMTVLLVRYTYFSDGSQFEEVPARVVMKLFLDQGVKNNTLHVFQYDRKIGYASIDARVLRPLTGSPNVPMSYNLKIWGLIEKGAIKGVDDAINWNVDVRMKDVDEFEQFKGRFRMRDAGLMVNFDWSHGAKVPRIDIYQRGEPIADDPMIRTILSHLLGGGATASLLPGGREAVQEAGSVQIISRQGSINLGGQKRSGYTIEIGGMERWKLKAYFTEAGELALVNLPEGYRLMEPVIHGLTPDYGKEEEE